MNEQAGIDKNSNSSTAINLHFTQTCDNILAFKILKGHIFVIRVQIFRLLSGNCLVANVCE